MTDPAPTADAATKTLRRYSHRPDSMMAVLLDGKDSKVQVFLTDGTYLGWIEPRRGTRDRKVPGERIVLRGKTRTFWHTENWRVRYETQADAIRALLAAMGL